MRQAIGGRGAQFGSAQGRASIWEDPPRIVDGIPLLAAYVRVQDLQGHDRRVRIGYWSPPPGIGFPVMRGGSSQGSGYLYTERELRNAWTVNFERAGLFREAREITLEGELDLEQERPTPGMVTRYWSKILGAALARWESPAEVTRREAVRLDRKVIRPPEYPRSSLKTFDPRFVRQREKSIKFSRSD